jgi:hypothetical protein
MKELMNEKIKGSRAKDFSELPAASRLMLKVVRPFSNNH